MDLLTQEIQAAMPPLYAQDGKGEEAIVFARFFTPWTGWTWWATEATAEMRDGRELPLVEVSLPDLLNPSGPVEDVRFFGLVQGMETELGYFSLRELQSVKGPGGLRIEVDLFFSPRSLREAQRM